ncbi:MAG: hypothetical protein ABW220_18025 [Burkholderiaceae bacterium]
MTEACLTARKLAIALFFAFVTAGRWHGAVSGTAFLLACVVGAVAILNLAVAAMGPDERTADEIDIDRF